MLQSTMLDILRISLVFVSILVLLRKKIGIGYVMLISSLLLFLLYGMTLSEGMLAIRRAVTGGVTVKLLLALSLIRIFEQILREQKLLSLMMGFVKKTFVSRKAVMVSMPLLIGMLPSLGGAYFSAPMVKEATEGMQISQEEKAFINYWFRHPWEFMLPLYPGIVFASAVSAIPLNSLILANLLCAVGMLLSGFIFSMNRINMEPGAHIGDSGFLKRGAWLSFLPIATVLFLVLVMKMELYYALVIVLIPLLAYYKYGISEILRSLKYGFSIDVIVMIGGIVIFKEIMEASGSVATMSNLLLEYGIPVVPIFCLLPFIAGLLTGHTIGFVGSTFPLLLSITDHASTALMSLAFASGLIGVLLSPVHLCLILSREYFLAELSGIYKKTVPAGFMVFFIALSQYIFSR